MRRGGLFVTLHFFVWEGLVIDLKNGWGLGFNWIEIEIGVVGLVDKCWFLWGDLRLVW